MKWVPLLIGILITDATIMVTIPNTGPNAGTATFTQATVADAIVEIDGSITARVLSDPEATDTYAVGEQVTATVNVMDNDDDSLPSIMISRKGTSTTDITEGTDAVFEVSAANPISGTPPTNTIMVKVQITQSGYFLKGSSTYRNRSSNVWCSCRPDGDDHVMMIMMRTMVVSLLRS